MNLSQTTATVLIVLLALIIVGLLIILIRTRRLAVVPQPLLIVDEEEVDALPQPQPLRISRYPLFHVPTHQGIWNVPHEPPHGPYNLPNGALRGPHYYK
jgi:hypothetical protein